MACSARKDSTSSMAWRLLRIRSLRPPLGLFEWGCTFELIFGMRHEAEATNHCACRAGRCCRARMGFGDAQSDSQRSNDELHSELHALGGEQSADSMGRTQACAGNRV